MAGNPELSKLQQYFVDALDSYVPYAMGAAILIVIGIVAQALSLTWLEKALVICLSAIAAFMVSACFVGWQRAKSEDRANLYNNLLRDEQIRQLRDGKERQKPPMGGS